MTSELSEKDRSSQASAVSLRLESQAENVMLVRQAIEGAARALGASEEVIDDLKLAVTEACSNVVKYAYRGEPGPLEVSFLPVDSGFVVQVRDEGQWLTRSENESVGGLGIPLMEAVTRACEITADEAGTAVTLDFPLERIEDDLAADAEPGSPDG